MAATRVDFLHDSSKVLLVGPNTEVQQWSFKDVMTPPVVPQVKPLYNDDCSECLFVGNIRTESGMADVYYHEDRHNIDPIIKIRYSSEPSDNATYRYGIVRQFPLSEELTKALKLINRF